MKQAKFKFNSGTGALLCSKCSKIIKTGSDFTTEEWKAMRGEIELPPAFCKECEGAVFGLPKMTAVETLFLELTEFIDIDLRNTEVVDIFRKAIELEKQQMFEYVQKMYVNGEHSFDFHAEEFEKYYNETYKIGR